MSLGEDILLCLKVAGLGMSLVVGGVLMWAVFLSPILVWNWWFHPRPILESDLYKRSETMSF